MLRYRLGLLSMLGVLSGCPHMEAPEKAIFVQADVLFSYEDGKPAKNELVYVVESFNHIFLTTLVTKTDENGRVVLNGYFCTPAYVAANGGNIVIKRMNVENSYHVTIRKDRFPNLEKGFGPPLPDPTYKQPRRSENCEAN